MTPCTLWVKTRRKLKEQCGGTIRTYQPTTNPADDFDRCESCGAQWSRDSKGDHV